jgi:tetratricopeptide (TPR) repeat protein
MPAPPKVFISAASGDLRGARQVVKEALLTIGCHPVEQTNFPPDYRTVSDMLRGKIEECQALIHIAGPRYGAEPDPACLPPDVSRRSYTQMEHHLARELAEQRGDQRFRVYTFVCPEDFPYDNEPDSEPAEKRELQARHRRAILDGHALYETPKNPDALKERVQLLREEVLQLRAAQNRRERLTLAGIALLLLALAGIGYGVYHYLPGKTTEQVAAVFHADPVLLRAKLEEQVETSFQAKLTELKQNAAPPADIDQLYRQRDQTVARLDEAVKFISATAAETASTLVRKAAQTLQERGVEAALELLDKAVVEQGQRLKKQTRELAEAALFKAELHESKLDYANARKSIEEAISLDYRWWEPHNRLGLLALNLAQWDLAEKELKEAEQFLEQEEDRATVLNNLAQLLKATNRLAEAEPLMRRALAIDERSYGPDHPKVARDLNNLAQLLQATNRLAEAEPLMRRALAIDERSYGPDHPKVARDLNNLAQLLQATNRLAEAEPLMARVVSIFEKSLGENHPNVATALNNLATLLQATNRLAEAEPLMRRAVEILLKFTANTGHQHPHLRTMTENYTELLADMGLDKPRIAARLAELGKAYGVEWVGQGR